MPKTLVIARYRAVSRGTVRSMTTVSRTLRLPEHLQEALRETARREGRSENAVVVAAIERYTTERTRRRDEALARIVAEDRALLDRLAE